MPVWALERRALGDLEVQEGRNVGSSQQITLGHSDSYVWFMGFLDFSLRKTEYNV